MHDLVHPLFHPFRVLWTERITLFWPIWTTLTAFGVFFTLWLLPKRQTQPRSQQSFSRQEMSRTEATALIFLLGILACYSAGILFGEEFTYYDDSHFTNGSLIGRPIDIQIAPEQGRFWPLGHQEFNLVGHLTKTVSGYHGFRILELVCVSAFLLGLLKDRGAWARVGLILLALVTPSIIISFSGLIYPEANEILLLTSLAWFVCRLK